MNQLKRRRRRGVRIDRIILIVILIGAVVCLALLISGKLRPGKQREAVNSGTTIVDVSGETGNPGSSEDVRESDDVPQESAKPQRISFEAEAVDGTRPEDFNMTTALEVDGERVSSYTADEPFDFGFGSEYTEIEGVISFRGNNFRDGGTYGRIGSLDIQYDAEGKPVWGNILEKAWSVPTYGLQKGAGGSPSAYQGTWTGSGWTGQPIIVKWDSETKQHMNMADWAKADDDLVEVIYATMDGNIYFLDLATGNATRNKMKIDLPFKGAGSLDPRGYPILYLGAGDSYDRSSDFRPAKAMAINLLDCSIMYEFGKKPDSFGLREWTAYDSSALICAENDCLVYPGENGILYVVKLNTQYDKASGTLSMNPSRMIKLRYSTPRNERQGFALGYEGSAAAYSHYVFLTENSGMMHCVDLNTMKVVWVQDTADDTNCSPVFSIEDGECYLYIGNTIDGTLKNGKGTSSFYKIEASTGRVVWQIDRELYSDKHITGGVMSCAVVGREKLEGRVYFLFESYSDYSGAYAHILCVNTDDGTIIWEGPLSTYAWSSPAAVYDEDGNGYLVQCNCGGNVYLIDGGADTYEKSIIDKFVVEPHTNIEATPAVYNDMIVIGTRVSGIWGIRIKAK